MPGESAADAVIVPMNLEDPAEGVKKLEAQLAEMKAQAEAKAAEKTENEKDDAMVREIAEAGVEIKEGIDHRLMAAQSALLSHELGAAQSREQLEMVKATLAAGGVSMNAAFRNNIREGTKKTLGNLRIQERAVGRLKAEIERLTKQKLAEAAAPAAKPEAVAQ